MIAIVFPESSQHTISVVCGTGSLYENGVPRIVYMSFIAGNRYSCTVSMPSSSGAESFMSVVSGSDSDSSYSHDE